MALKVLLLRKKRDDATKNLESVRSKLDEIKKREDEVAVAIEEAKTDEEKEAVEAAVAEIESEKADAAAEAAKLGEEIAGIEAEIAQLEAEQKKIEEEAAKKSEPSAEERKGLKIMETRKKFFGLDHAERSAFFANGEVKAFLERTRSLGMEKRAVTGAELTIPTVVLDLVRRETEKESKLLKYTRYRQIAGKGRQNVVGEIPEAVWTESCARINELELIFNAIEVDAFKVGGAIPICNSILEDSDENLAAEIIAAIAKAIAKALDMAILFGTGIKMPLGVATRLAQTEAPADYPATAPAWTDLHTTNVLTLNIAGSTGTEYFASLMGALGVAKPVYTTEGLCWVMNRKTHLAVLAKALNFNAAGVLVSGIDKMPIIGGDIIEFEDERIQDNEIIGGFFGNYFLAERNGGVFEQSREHRFLDDVTEFKGTGRYDGKPLAGEAFVVVNFNNTAPATSHAFPTDYANANMNLLTVTAAAGSATGKTVLTVTDTIAESAPVLKYKLRADIDTINVGDKVSGWTDLTSGTTAITAAAGTVIAVVELDANSRVVSVGSVASVPKTT